MSDNVKYDTTWSKALIFLEEMLDNKTFHVWIETLRVQEVDGKMFIVTPNTSAYKKVKSTYIDVIKDAVSNYHPTIEIILLDGYELSKRQKENELAIKRGKATNEAFLSNSGKAISNELANSDVFAPVKLKSSNRLIRSHDDWFVNLNKTEMAVGGAQLDYRDSRLYAEIVLKCKKSPTEYVSYSQYELVKAMGLAVNGGAYKKIDAMLHRLVTASVHYRDGLFDEEQAANLIDHWKRDGKKILIKLGEGALKLYEGDKYSFIPHIDKLDGPMPQWLYQIVTTNKKGVRQHRLIHKNKRDPETEVTLMDMSLRLKTRKNVFRKSVKTAMEEILSVGAVSEYEIEYCKNTDHWILHFTPN